MNNENNNNQDLIHVGNDLNNQEINEQPSSEQQNQTPMYNRSSASMMKDGLHKGMNKIKERKNNAALGQSGINGQKNPMKVKKSLIIYFRKNQILIKVKTKVIRIIKIKMHRIKMIIKIKEIHYQAEQIKKMKTETKLKINKMMITKIKIMRQKNQMVAIMATF